MVEDCDGVDIKQFNDSISMSSEGHIEQMLKTHGWDNESSDCPKPCKDGETKGHLIASPPVDHLTCIHEGGGFKEGIVEHSMLEKKIGFQHRVALGELMHAMATVTPDTAHSVTILSKFSNGP